ncbi:MAG: A/G-specific adenine glycosylase [Rhodospirillaceae bacterium]|nr:A/G-specific adenine glycosylase [Rhodospirillaceae bacterium]
MSRNISRQLLAWYDIHRRDLPWRAGPGMTADPYRVWLSEIMLQQTTVATVKTYYGNFLAKWPEIEKLAAAELDEVLHAWQGLGYYSRARNLHKCAREIVAAHDGRFPADEQCLRKLPGIGPYTAAAIAAIAFGLKATPVDGNIERVTARLHAINDPLPGAKKDIKSFAEAMTPDHRAGDFAQALMDLGATVCKPKHADCPNCPLGAACRAGAGDNPERFPVKAPKKARPTRYGIVFWAERDDGAVLLRRRAEEGLLGGMAEFPSTDWMETPWAEKPPDGFAPIEADWLPMPGTIVHIFTHFRLELGVVRARVEGALGSNLDWCHPDSFGARALPTVMKKVARHVLDTP